MWHYLLEQPAPLVGAVLATAVSLVLLVTVRQPYPVAAASGAAQAVYEQRRPAGEEGALFASPPESTPPTVPEPPPPPSRRERYRVLSDEAAKTCPGLPAGVLFAIAGVETNHGRDKRVSKAGAVGPMQFLPRTWRAYAIDGDGDGRRDITNPADALHTAARHLCLNGGAEPEGLRRAIWNYNHSHSYVERVLRLARSYGS